MGVTGFGSVDFAKFKELFKTPHQRQHQLRPQLQWHASSLILSMRSVVSMRAWQWFVQRVSPHVRFWQVCQAAFQQWLFELLFEAMFFASAWLTLRQIQSAVSLPFLVLCVFSDIEFQVQS